MHVQGTVEVDLDDLVPELHIRIEEVIELIPARIVDQDTGAGAGLFLEGGDRGLDRRVIRNVAGLP